VPKARSRRKDSAARRTLVDALASPACYPGEVQAVRVVETHISVVFLTGTYAYKIKKPLKLPFLDFSTLARRRHFCREEVRLNRRLAPSLYLGIVPIGGSPKAPRVGGKPAIEYAVKMREFPADALLDAKLAEGAVTAEALTDFAARLAAFHRGLKPVARDYTDADASMDALGNVAQLRRYVSTRGAKDVDSLEAWTKREIDSLRGVFTRRASAGAHRECHGDLHLQNVLWHQGAIEAFDALEFDPRLREIDSMSEVAFLAMDLIAHERADLAYRFVNRYLEESGDYDGVHVLRFYLAYRALVRAKVAAIKRAQSGQPASDVDYVATAVGLVEPRTPLLLITHGLSGSGKTHLTQELVGRLPALRVRSDLERKRLHGLAALSRSGSAIGQGLYSAAEGTRTYVALAAAADTLLRHGFDAIVDATFLRRRDRLEFRQVAAANAARFAILECRASADELKSRVARRASGGKDASEAGLAVLEHQLRTAEPLDDAELRSTVRVDTERPTDYARLAAAITRR
jgi:aminoglycoside phosphotransferase family enzyme/predicted kinase